MLTALVLPGDRLVQQSDKAVEGIAGTPEAVVAYTHMVAVGRKAGNIDHLEVVVVAAWPGKDSAAPSAASPHHHHFYPPLPH